MPRGRYANVSSSTPQYKMRGVGVPLPTLGGGQGGFQRHADYPSVLSHDPNANAIGNGSCLVAIEGCMDGYAANFDPLANVNTNTW